MDTQENTERRTVLELSLKVIEEMPQENTTIEEMQRLLEAHINRLIEMDFNRLISILYRIDVSEEKLKKALAENNDTGAGKIIAELIVERQQQKLISRKKYGPSTDWL